MKTLDGNEATNWFKNHRVLTGVALAIIVVGLASSLAEPPRKQPSRPTATPSSIRLDAEVTRSVDVAGLVITNNEAVAWDNCKVEINDEYTNQINNSLRPNVPLNIPFGLFTESDGARFNPITHAVNDIYISCKVEGNARSAIFKPTN